MTTADATVSQYFLLLLLLSLLRPQRLLLPWTLLPLLPAAFRSTSVQTGTKMTIFAASGAIAPVAAPAA